MAVAPSTIAAIILAAGNSSRLGRAKQVLEIDGMSLLQRSCQVAIESGLSPIVVVLGSEADRCARELNDLPVQTLINANWRAGIGCSIRCGVQAVQAAIPTPEALTIMLCDQPLVGASLIGRLIKAFRATTSPIVACRYEQTLGVPALFARSHYAHLTALPDACGAKRVIAEAATRGEVAAIDFPGGSLDVDTQADFERLLESMPKPSSHPSAFSDRSA